MAPQIAENTRRLYSITNWRDFVFGSGSTSGMESVHDSMHVHTGGANGHMRFVEVAGKVKINTRHILVIDRSHPYRFRPYFLFASCPS